MKESKFLLSVGLLVLSTFGVAVAVPCACGPEPVIPTQGGFAFASFGNGAAFSWSNYVPPVVKINQNGTSTTVTTTAGYFKNGGQVAGVSKFMFYKNMYTANNMNKINPDIVELQKVLASEGMLGQNSQTGVYDATTKAAVEAFQKKHGIKPAPQYTYGYFGPLTRGFLNNR